MKSAVAEKLHDAPCYLKFFKIKIICMACVKRLVVLTKESVYGYTPCSRVCAYRCNDSLLRRSWSYRLRVENLLQLILYEL